MIKNLVVSKKGCIFVTKIKLPPYFRGNGGVIHGCYGNISQSRSRGFESRMNGKK